MNISHRLQRLNQLAQKPSKRTRSRIGLVAVAGLGLASAFNVAQAKDPWGTHQMESLQTAIAACTLLTDVKQIGDEYIAVGDRGIIVKASVADVQASINDFDPNSPPDCGFTEDKEIQTDASGNKLTDEDGEFLYANAATPAAFNPLCICHTVHRWESSENDPDYYRYNNPEWRIWKQVQTPTRAMLTGVSFAPDNKNGFAVGYDAIILKTTDGGNTWTTQDVTPEGMALPYEIEAAAAGEKVDLFPMPLLDVRYFNAQRGLAVGAFGLVKVTNDGGKTWTRVALGEDNDFELHLNSIVELNDGTIVIVGEMGNVFHSLDAGKTWTLTESGYEGSFFGAVPMGTSGIVAFGLRGTVYVNNDIQNPEGWQAVETGSIDTLMGGAVTGPGSAIAVGSKGSVMNISGNGASVSPGDNPNEDPLAEVLPIDGGFIVVGAKGVQFIPAQ